MCQGQNIPSNTRIERLQSMLATAEETTRDAQDIFALERGLTDSNDRIVENMNHTAANLDVNSIVESLLNQGRIRIPYALPDDYEKIFECPDLSRRNARPMLPEQTTIPVEWLLLMEDWLALCLDDSSEDLDWEMPNDMGCFHEIMEHGMPARLDLTSWPGRILLNIVAEQFPFDALKDCFCEWQPWMGTYQILFHRGTDGQQVASVTFVGVAQPGRLGWAPMVELQAPLRLGRGFVWQIEQIIRNAEAALVALARRIARHTACSIVYQYAAPLAEDRGYEVLTREQIVRAVKEILGDAWFDLPFDVDGSLRNW